MQVKQKSLSHVGLCNPMDCSPWSSPGQNTGVGSLSLFQGKFPTQGSNPGINPWSPALEADTLTSEPPGKPTRYWDTEYSSLGYTLGPRLSIFVYSIVVSVKPKFPICHFLFFPFCFHSSVQSFSYVWFFATPSTTACQASLSFTISQSLLKLCISSP